VRPLEVVVHVLQLSGLRVEGRIELFVGVVLVCGRLEVGRGAARHGLGGGNAAHPVTASRHVGSQMPAVRRPAAYMCTAAAALGASGTTVATAASGAVAACGRRRIFAVSTARFFEQVFERLQVPRVVPVASVERVPGFVVVRQVPQALVVPQTVHGVVNHPKGDVVGARGLVHVSQMARVAQERQEGVVHVLGLLGGHSVQRFFGLAVFVEEGIRLDGVKVLVEKLRRAQNVHFKQDFHRGFPLQRFCVASALAVRCSVGHGTGVRAGDVALAPQHFAQGLNLVRKSVHRGGGGAVDFGVEIMAPRAPHELVNVPVGGRVELLAHRHPSGLLQGAVVFGTPRRLDVIVVAVQFPRTCQKRRRVVVPGRAHHAIGIHPIAEFRRIAKRVVERPTAIHHRVQFVVRARVPKPVVAENETGVPIGRAVKGRLHGEVPVGGCNRRVYALQSLLPHQGQGHVAGDKPRPLVPVVAVQSATVIQVQPSEVVLGEVLGPVQLLAGAGGYVLQDLHRREPRFPVRVKQGAHFPPHVLAHDFRDHFGAACGHAQSQAVCRQLTYRQR